MELRHLRYFVLVAEELHFARAAQRLGISQPPLSQQIRLLEDELGVRLFDRTSRRVTLTPAGALFLDAARATLNQAERAVTVARRAALGELGTLRIGFNASAPLIPRVAMAIHDYRERFSDVELSLSEIAGPAQVAALAAGSLDIGFLRSAAPPVLPPTIVGTRLISERLYVAMRPDHPLAARPTLRFADLAGEPLLVYAIERSGGFTEELFGLLRAAGVEPLVGQSVHEVATLLGLAAAGVGLAVLAQSLCALQSAGLAYVPLDDASARTAMWLIRRQDERPLPVRHFLGLVAGEEAGAAD